MEKRRSIIGSALSASLVSGLALVVIFGLLTEDRDNPLAIFVDGLLQIVAVVAAFAVLIGILNLLLSVHLRRLLSFKRGWIYSWITVLSALGVFAVYALDETDYWTGELEGEKLSPLVYQVAQVVLQSAMVGLLLFFLVYAAYRLMRQHVNWANVLFITAVLVAILGYLPISDNMTALSDFRDWLLRVPATAGARGLLIGIGLGTVTVGVRILLAQERIYRQRG